MAADLAELPDGPPFDPTTYQFPGPVSERFFADRSAISFIQGPYGSGKTTVCFFKALDRALRMPVCRDGIRRYKLIVLRDVYRRMERTAIRSWHKWFPATVGKWTGGQDRPSSHEIILDCIDGVELHFVVEFMAVGDLDIEDFMGGLETTDMMLNEANLQHQDVLTYGFGRCGRFPALKDLPPDTTFDYGVFGDLNAPEPESWITQLQFGILDEDLTELGEMKYFCQPGGRDPGAENTENLPKGYYLRLAAANKHQAWWVRRMVDNKVGYSRHGKPIYEEYNDLVHCAPEPIAIAKGVPIGLGFDAGLHPAGVATQRLPNGQKRVIAEFYFDRCGPTRFAEQVKAWRDTHAKGCPIAYAYADPSAFDGVDEESGESGWIDIVESVLGLTIWPAPSNEPVLRQDAVRQDLLYMIDGTAPALVISPACKMLRQGFASNYRYQRLRKDTGDEWAPRPDKNKWSNLHDALQYDELGERGREAVVARAHGTRQTSNGNGAVVMANTGFSAWGR